MKVHTPTRYQAALLGRALVADKFSEQRRALWAGVFKQAAACCRHYHLTWDAEQLVDYWLSIQPEEVQAHSIELDDMTCGFQTIAQESGAVVVPLDSLEEFGDTWQEAPASTITDRLGEALEWRDDVHPVTARHHLPRWTDGHCDPDPESHLEPAFNGFEGLNPLPVRR